MKAQKDKFPFLNLRPPENENPIWILTTLQLSRNLKAFNFPPVLSENDKETVRGRLCSKLAGECIRAEDLGPLEKEFLYEHFFTPDSFQQVGKGQGFLVGDNQLVTFNVGNHLTMQVMEIDKNIETAFEQLFALEDVLSAQYAFSNRFGYLTSDQTMCGTALVGRLCLHVPALIHTKALGVVMEHLEEVEGSVDDLVGDLLVVRNRCTVGLSEEDILEQLRTTALKVIVAEKRARKEIAEEPGIKDKVSRAYGLAMHSYQLETREAWGALSLIKLGFDLGFVTSTSHKQLNELMFTCRRAHLVAEFGVEVSHEELPHRRAEFIHGSLREAHLAI